MITEPSLFDIDPEPAPLPTPLPAPTGVAAPDLAAGPAPGVPSAGGEALFDLSEYDDWRDLWVDMPAYDSQNQKPADVINVQFATHEDRRDFLTLLGEDPARRKSIWYPSVAYLTQSERGAERCTVPPGAYPIYVISKGRWEKPLTANALERLGLDYRLVIEPPEQAAYATTVNPARHLLLPFHDLGEGSIPARNFVWQHALERGAARHWILDDNLGGFYRLNENRKYRVVNENPFASVEQFADRYTNCPMAGLNYEFFADRRARTPPLVLNTRVYSCILLDTGMPHRWRGRYNEDTDLSIRFLKDGYCTALFNHYLCKKMPTMTMTGGNTDQLYQDDGRLKMAQSLVDQHPDVVTITDKWGRKQHQVNYGRFKGNQLIAKVAP